MRITFTVPGEPQGKGRPRFANIKGKVVTRTPGETVLYENLIRSEYRNQCGDSKFSDTAELEMWVMAYYKIPLSASKTKKLQMESGAVRPIKKPDADNVVKVVADSLNNIAYRDDAQIVELQFSKLYSTRPRIEVTIRERLGSNDD